MKSLLIALLFLLTPVASAQKKQKITSAFGIKLGQEFSPKKALKSVLGGDRTIFYYFKPPKRKGNFTHYMVVITPKTHRVAEIWIGADYATQAEAEKGRDTIIRMLESRYGERDIGSVHARNAEFYGGCAIVQGKRYIMIYTVPEGGKTRLLIKYVHETYKKLVQAERRGLEKAKLEVPDDEVLEEKPGHSSDGMVADFFVINEIVEKLILVKVDHQYLNEVFEFRPTAENLALNFLETLKEHGRRKGIDFVKVKLWESPTSYCEVGKF